MLPGSSTKAGSSKIFCVGSRRMVRVWREWRGGRVAEASAELAGWLGRMGG